MPNKAQTVLPAPDAMERTEIARAIERTTSRRSRFHVAAGFASDHSDERGFSARALDALGSTAPAFAGRVFEHIHRLATPHGETSPDITAVNAALAYIDGLEPANEMEALAALSIYAAQDTALLLIARLRQTTQVHELELNANAAAKLMRAATGQMEAFGKMRRGGGQTVRVEHVHVHAGGQAVVGNVNHGGALQPPAPALAGAAAIALPDIDRGDVVVSRAEKTHAG